MTRSALAHDITAGLAGWFQLQIAQHLGQLSGEDAARLIVAQIVNAQGRYAPATSQLPRNWGHTKKRVDIALKPRSTGAQNWYGAVEIKWPGNSFDADQLRTQVVQDVMRLTFIETGNLNARFLVLGGTHQAIDMLFDKTHPRAQVKESRRIALNSLLRRAISVPDGELDHPSWSTHYPDAGDRVPTSVFGTFDGKLKATLLSSADAVVGGWTEGSVFVWQCARSRGTVP